MLSYYFFRNSYENKCSLLPTPTCIYRSVNSFSVYLLSIYYILGTVNVTKRIRVSEVASLLTRRVYSRERKRRHNFLMRH